jgi:acyl phosphate:glycerol-3-phosphate acyltransferase
LLVIVSLLIGSYLFGSIPVGVIVGRAFGFDPRKVGSGNIGMTNVSRAGGKRAGAVTFLGDLLKGFIPAFAASISGLSPQLVALVGLGAFLGAIASVFLGFHGGKGISASLGIWLAIAPIPILVALGVFVALFGAFRVVSLASIGAAIALVPSAAMAGVPRPYLGLAILMTALVLLRHHENIVRLIKGTEPPVGGKPAAHENVG